MIFSLRRASRGCPRIADKCQAFAFHKVDQLERYFLERRDPWPQRWRWLLDAHRPSLCALRHVLQSALQIIENQASGRRSSRHCRARNFGHRVRKPSQRHWPLARIAVAIEQLRVRRAASRDRSRCSPVARAGPRPARRIARPRSKSCVRLKPICSGC